jgi:hypothetical protein
VERALIEAMSRRYVEQFDPDKRREQDLAYPEAMRAVHERFPKDLEAGTLYGEALFVMEPRRRARQLRERLGSVPAVDGRIGFLRAMCPVLHDSRTKPSRTGE